jgi:hypothetical protein
MDPKSSFPGQPLPASNPLPGTTPSNPLSSGPQPPVSNDPKTQVIERLKGSVNVLVTVSNNPSVDQLAAAIGFTLVLNKLKKHGTAVFSGQIPSTLEFLQPEKTIEKNTDSLRDFIVSLDKSKADKLRYKIEDKYVKIFITPYHTSLSETDLEFGQGDLNVDVIIALGVNKREELDQAVTAHGRILHDATIVSITRQASDDMGTINWHVPGASSFSEVLVDLSESLKSPELELFDQQIATAFLTGIVAETDRFSNDKTTPQTMSISGILMKAGANQQLIANKLEEPVPIPQIVERPVTPQAMASVAPIAPPVPPKPSDGSLQVPHEDLQANQVEEPEPEDVAQQIEIDDEGKLVLSDNKDGASSVPTGDSLPPVVPNSSGYNQVNLDDQTLEDIEKSVRSPHLVESGVAADSAKPGDITSPTVDTPVSEAAPAPSPVPEIEDLPHISEAEARRRVEEAENQKSNDSVDNPTKPIEALNSVPVDLNFGNDSQSPATSIASAPEDNAASTDSSAPSNLPPPPPLPPPIA